MNVSITIDTVTISITEKGYERLRSRMATLLTSVPESIRELVSADAEKRLAEYFSSKLTDGNAIFTEADVDNAFSELGFGKAKEGNGGSEKNEAADDKNSDNSMCNSETETQDGAKGDGAPLSGENDNDAGNSKRSFWRSKSQVVIGGVCGGISEKYDIDVVWVRLAFVAITLFFVQPWFFVVYLILWIILPINSSRVEDGVILNGPEGSGGRGGCLRCCFVALVLGLAFLAICLFFAPVLLLWLFFAVS